MIIDIENLDLKVTKIDGDVAEIQTSLGTVEGKIVTIEVDTATIITDLGEVETEVCDTAGKRWEVDTIIIRILVLALIAAVVSIISMFYLRKRPT